MTIDVEAVIDLLNVIAREQQVRIAVRHSVKGRSASAD